MKNSDTLKWLWKTPGKKKGLIILLTAVQAVLGGYGVIYALLLRNTINSAVEHDGISFRRGIFLMVFLMIGQLALQAVVRWLNELSKSSLENAFKQRLTESILQKDYSSVSAVHTGEWMNRLTGDTVIVSDEYVDILPGLASMAVRLISALVALIVIDKAFAAVLIPGGLLLIILSYAFRRVLRQLHRNIQESDGRLRVFLQERIESLAVIKAFSAEEVTGKTAENYMADHKAARMKRNWFSNICNIGFGASMRGLYLFGIIYCAYGILHDTISYGTLVAVMQLAGQIQTPFANITGFIPRWNAMAGSAERLMEIEAFEDDISDEFMDQEEAVRFYTEDMDSFGMKDVSFRYPGDNMPEVLHRLSFDIKKGETVAFTGNSGCGKSTVLKLLMCLYPVSSGELYAGGKELTSRYRRLFAYVPQGNLLMNGTVRDVIAFADIEGRYDEGRIRNALRTACADRFVEELENGLDTELGERGSGLSEGQMQRLAIARAVFSERPILLLDEATSALDQETEEKLLNNLQKLTDKTIIIVTHKPAALSICDRVLRFTESGVTEDDQ